MEKLIIPISEANVDANTELAALADRCESAEAHEQCELLAECGWAMFGKLTGYFEGEPQYDTDDIKQPHGEFAKFLNDGAFENAALLLISNAITGAAVFRRLEWSPSGIATATLKLIEKQEQPAKYFVGEDCETPALAIATAAIRLYVAIQLGEV